MFVWEYVYVQTSYIYINIIHTYNKYIYNFVAVALIQPQQNFSRSAWRFKTNRSKFCIHDANWFGFVFTMQIGLVLFSRCKLVWFCFHDTNWFGFVFTIQIGLVLFSRCKLAQFRFTMQIGSVLFSRCKLVWFCFHDANWFSFVFTMQVGLVLFSRDKVVFSHHDMFPRPNGPFDLRPPFWRSEGLLGNGTSGLRSSWEKEQKHHGRETYGT